MNQGLKKKLALLAAIATGGVIITVESSTQTVMGIHN